MASVTVIAGWIATYDDPVILAKDVPVTPTGRTDIWDGHRWLWAIAPDGCEGWVPDTLIEDGTALEDYSAGELTCANGDILARGHATHGWTWCIAPDGRSGWVPDSCLSTT